MKMPSVASVATTSSLWLAFMSTCCFAWPAQYRRSYQYFPPMMTDLGPNPWDVAQEPLSYEQPEDYYDNSQWADVEALSNLIEMYDNAPPVWGQIVREKPVEELEELKRSQKMKRPSPSLSVSQGKVTLSPPSFSQTPSPYETSTAAPNVKVQSASSSAHHVNSQTVPVQVFQRGQKEVPLLRPPTKSKAALQQQQQQQQQQNQHQQQPSLHSIGEDSEVIAAQLTSSERQKKPSAYDTLRKYLSLEDALEKEKEKRRSHTHQKRSKNFVAEEGSLTGQLNNLKKSVV